jgi:hypothetical protein
VDKTMREINGIDKNARNKLLRMRLNPIYGILISSEVIQVISPASFGSGFLALI